MGRDFGLEPYVWWPDACVQNISDYIDKQEQRNSTENFIEW